MCCQTKKASDIGSDNDRPRFRRRLVLPGGGGRVRGSLRAQVASALRAAIREFQLQPGQRLIEREIVERLGVSRTTVREALSELASEGLVTVTPQKGATVATPTFKDAMDLYEVRGELEAIIVQRFIERATEEQFSALEAAVDNFQAVTSDFTEFRQLLVAKDAFYDVLVTGADSPSLRGLLMTIHARLQVIRGASPTAPDRSIAVAEELSGILAAIKRRDVALAKRRTREHISAAAADTLMGIRYSE